MSNDIITTTVNSDIKNSIHNKFNPNTYISIMSYIILNTNASSISRNTNSLDI